MNKRSTTPQIKQLTSSSTLVAVAVFMVLASPMGVYADRYDDKITSLESQIDSYENIAGELASQANTYQNKVNQFNAQKNTIQAQINLNEAKQDKIARDIVINEQKKNQQQRVLGDTLGDMYVGAAVSPIEMLASSNNIGDYLDQAEYQSSIRDNLQDSIEQIKVLKAELATQKKAVERIIADQESRRNALAQKEAEQARLAAQTRGEESAYQQLISSNKTQIQQERAAQAAAYQSYIASTGNTQVAGDSSKGGYPSLWANAPQDSLVDDWGMYNRECVSYTAWRVANSGKYMPYWGGSGHAYQWPGNARAAGIPVNGTPKVGSIAIWGVEDIGGGYGHSAYVEAVNADGSIYVSQYNVTPGQYSEMDVTASEVSRLEFIHFR